MIKYKNTSDIDYTSNEGKLLVAALSIITTEIYTMQTPDQALSKIIKLCNEIYWTPEEIKNEILKDKLNEILKP